MGSDGQDQQQADARQSEPTELKGFTALVHRAVDSAQGDAIALLDILRLLERLHREITEDAFQTALPQNRQELYKLLRVIEEEGGWPHIPRLKLQQLAAHLQGEQSD